MSSSNHVPRQAPDDDRSTSTPNRWIVLVGGVLVQLAMGAVYAWSTFAAAFQSDNSALQLTPVQALSVIADELHDCVQVIAKLVFLVESTCEVQ